ncbi:hypothetical protein [Acinetobacter bereziniae]|uniref:Uncharacterized protein n=1 Tax=Acinetobacter bereziniae NIPH 3 TaxID=1217651 RepID=N8YKA6_ACIBZ|nr:hypothetical protein [Acinetobacter bereziniae]ENV21754.1 hypothetical protein F963_02147 [Acinetobacter bereziniae NIPH 3]
MKKIIFLLFVLLNQSVFAAMCTGRVSGVSVNPRTGGLFANTVGGLSSPLLCSTSTTLNEISPSNCNKLFAVLLTAQITKRSVTLIFWGPQNCSDFEPWKLAEGLYHYILND